jgi:hypothetical protein
VRCAQDGVGYGAFVCQHLFAAGDATGEERVGFCSDDPTRENPWPDAWCYACDERFEADGEVWTDEGAEAAGISLVCHHCYERIRTNNDLDNDDWRTFDVPAPVLP